MEDECNTNDPNNLLPITTESLRFPLDNSMRIVFTGYYNGFGVELRSIDEIALLYHMGCFGKSTASRSKPKVLNNDNLSIMRKRQYTKRNDWCKKFDNIIETSESDTFLMDIDELTAKIVSDSKRYANKDVIDLVSSDEDSNGSADNNANMSHLSSIHCKDKHDTVVIVPNSDSEDEDYFASFKPKCCLNKIKIHEKLLLTLQEAFFLLYGLGCLQIINSDNKLLNVQQCWNLFTETDANFVPKYVVYHYFRSKGYIVKSGIKFGGDYLLYKEGPGIAHADYIVVIKQENDCSDWISILGHVRMAVTTVKEILIAEVVKINEDILTPEGLNNYSVREILLTRKIPITFSDDY